MPDVTSNLPDLNDSDILALERVVMILNERQGMALPMEGFRKEIIERFGQAGYKVDAKVWTTNQEGLYAFDIEIIDRLEGQFDPDQMVYEATNNVLDLGEGGVIKSAPLIAQQAHSHGKSQLWTPGSE